MVILQVLPELNSGGVERGAVDIANFLDRSGHKSIIISAGGKLQSFLSKGVEHITLKVNSKNPFRIYCNIKKIRKIIKEKKVDVLHVRSRAPAWSCYYAVKGTNCKLLTTFHGTYTLKLFSQKPSKLKKKYNEIMLKGSRVIAVSDFIKSHILENYPQRITEDKITVIHRGVDVDNFNSKKISQQMRINLINKWQLPEDKKIIVLPGRITPWKGHEFLLDALQMLNRDDYVCLFVGDFAKKTAFKKRLEQKIASANLEGKIRFLGASNNMATVYAIADVVISASTSPEAFGRVAIEGEVMEKIVIATNIGGSKETIINNETGFLIENKNVKDMCDKIDYALSISEIEQQRISSNAREYVVKNFSNNLMYEKTLEVYQNLLK